MDLVCLFVTCMDLFLILLALLLTKYLLSGWKDRRHLQLDLQDINPTIIQRSLETYSSVVVKNVFKPSESGLVMNILNSLPAIKPAHGWLGTFNFYEFGMSYTNSNDQIQDMKLIQVSNKFDASNLHEASWVMERLTALVPRIQFSNTEVHFWEAGNSMKAHVDPATHKDAVMIAVFGEFTGGKLCVEGLPLNLVAGDVLLLRGVTPLGLPMPEHSVQQIESGRRYSMTKLFVPLRNFTGMAEGAETPVKKWQKVTLPTGRHYMMYVPKPAPPKMPLIMFYHGSLGTAQKYIDKSNWILRADIDKFAICYGQSQNKGKEYDPPKKSKCYDPNTVHNTCITYGDYWWEANFPEADLRYTETIIEDMCDSFSIDEKRIYGVGFSNGGTFVSTLAIRMGTVFAAICSYMGGLQIENSAGVPYPSVTDRGKPRIYIITGELDEMLECCVKAKEEFEKAGYNTKFKNIPNQNHHYQVEMEDEIWAFFCNK